MEVDIELQPVAAMCFNTPLAFEGYKFTAENRFEHFSVDLSAQLDEIILNYFPLLNENLGRFYSLDQVNLKESIYWLNYAIQNDDCPNIVYDILFSHLEDVLQSHRYLELTPEQSLVLSNAGYIPMQLGQNYISLIKFYDSLKAVSLLGDFQEIIQKTKEVSLLAGAMEYCFQNLTESDYSIHENLRVPGGRSICPFCLKDLKCHSDNHLVKAHILSIREFHDPIVDQVVKSLAESNECPGVGKPSIEVDVEFMKFATIRHVSVLLLLDRVLNETNQRKRIRSAMSAKNYIQARHDNLMRYFRYYEKKAS